MSEYRMLTGWSPGWLRSAALYDGGDHLLQVTSLRLQHEYQRFPYTEIRAISVAEAPLWTGWRVARLVVLALSTGLALLPAQLGLRVGLALLPATLLVLQIWSIGRGRRCVARLISLSGEWPLPGLGTRRAVEEAVPRILERVQAAQAGLPRPEAMPVLLAGAAERTYRPVRGLGWATAGALLLSAALILVYRNWPALQVEIWSAAVFLVPATLTTSIAWWRTLRRRRVAAAALTGLLVLDLLLFLLFLGLVEWRRPSSSLTLAEWSLAAQSWEGLAAAVAVGWRVAAAAAAGWVERQQGEDGA
ncbi:MAG: hypothetical protein ACK6D7_25795 [Acidobacteriota bacterium]